MFSKVQIIRTNNEQKESRFSQKILIHNTFSIIRIVNWFLRIFDFAVIKKLKFSVWKIIHIHELVDHSILFKKNKLKNNNRWHIKIYGSISFSARAILPRTLNLLSRIPLRSHLVFLPCPEGNMTSLESRTVPSLRVI